jgi:ribonuclease P protein component
MIARELRLRRDADFDRVRSNGATRTSRLLVMKVLPNGLDGNRYGFAAGRRLGNAVQRNRAKRLMREAARALHPALAAGYDIVFIARNAFDDDTGYQAVATQMTDVLRRSGLIQDTEARACDTHSSG